MAFAAAREKRTHSRDSRLLYQKCQNTEAPPCHQPKEQRGKHVLKMTEELIPAICFAWFHSKNEPGVHLVSLAYVYRLHSQAVILWYWIAHNFQTTLCKSPVSHSTTPHYPMSDFKVSIFKHCCNRQFERDHPRIISTSRYAWEGFGKERDFFKGENRTKWPMITSNYIRIRSHALGVNFICSSLD